MWERIKRLVLGAPRDVLDPAVHHKISLIALMAWIGLGADGLSSSAYGPDEAFRALGGHYYLAALLAVAMALTVFVISFAYSKTIEQFPHGGGGYIVASRLLGPRVGVVSGAALLVDYVLTISVSIASGVDQVFSVLPVEWAHYKLLAAATVIGLLVVLNLRGVRESIAILAPIFLLFLVTHAILIFGGIGSHLPELPRVSREIHDGFRTGLASLGAMGMAGLFLRAYAMGGGTYTGIEAVSNGLQIMREPRVETAKRTMTYMAVSLAVTASGILFCYLLFRAEPEPHRTMNAVLLQRFAGDWGAAGRAFIVLTLAAEAGLLFVAAQTGFLDGPRIMSNMALDSWVPHRFAQLSDRLMMRDGIVIMGLASLAALLYTRGHTTALVTMYSINVFLTFSLTMLGMCRFWLQRRGVRWRRSLVIHAIGLILCVSILVVVIIEKFSHGAWVTLVVTSSLVALCFWVRHHYRQVEANLRDLAGLMDQATPPPAGASPPLKPKAPTAVLLVGRYGGLGVHGLLSIERLFPGHFKNDIFVEVGVVDAGAMKGAEELERVQRRTQDDLERYVRLAQRMGLAADSRMAVGVDVADEAERLCLDIAKRFPRAMFFANKLIFEEERWYQRLLHNETAYEIQRRLQFAGLQCMILPVRIFSGRRRLAPTDPVLSEGDGRPRPK